jgi:hypothetical protein
MDGMRHVVRAASLCRAQILFLTRSILVSLFFEFHDMVNWRRLWAMWGRMQNLDHLDRLALAAGFAAVPEDDGASALAKPAGTRFATPDAPAPRALVASGPSSVTASPTTYLANGAAATRSAVTFYVGTALKTAHTLVGGRRATV